MMENKNIVLIAAAAAAAYFLLKDKSAAAVDTASNPVQQKSALYTWIMSSTNDSDQTKIAFNTALNAMTDQEISAVYIYVFNYVQKGIDLAQGSDFYNQMIAISAKYNIFQ